jgi:polyhydroxyalkanoate synthesis regulator phasin
MNPDTLAQLIQKGFRVTLGATATLVESIKDPEQGAETFSRLQTDFNQLTEEWAEKGEVAEQEARILVERLWNSASNSTPPPAAPPPAPSSTPTPASRVQADLQDLTQQIAEIRAELEKLRGENPLS